MSIENDTATIGDDLMSGEARLDGDLLKGGIDDEVLVQEVISHHREADGWE